MDTAPAEIVSRKRAPYQKRKRPLRPNSHHIALGDIDGRRREAALMRETIEELTQHCGGRPSVVQRRLIHRAAVLHLRLTLMDQQLEEGDSMPERIGREYLAWNNAYCRTLRLLGLKGAPTERVPSLADIISAAD
jgi:hypothetical protein